MNVVVKKVLWIVCWLALPTCAQSEGVGDESAADCLNQAVDLYLAGQIQQAQPKLENVIAITNEEVRKNPENAVAYRLRAEAKSFFVRYAPEEVLADMARAIQLDPKAARSYFVRGRFLINRKAPQDAIKDLVKAIELDPTQWEYHNVCGFCRKQSFEYEQAILSFNEALRINPNSWNSFQLRAESLYSLGKYDEAIKDYLNAHRLTNKPSIRLYYTTAECYYQLGDYTLSIRYMNKAIDGSQDDVGCYLYLGHSHYALGNWREALENYDQAIKLNPKEGLHHHCRGIALKALGRSEEAIEAFEKSKQLGYSGQ